MTHTLRTATLADDAAIRALWSMPMPGEVVLSYQREPSYFAGCSIWGEAVETLVAEQEEVVGVICKSERTVYWQGQPTRVGYLGGWRLKPGHAGWIFGQTLSHLKNSSLPFYLISLTKGNSQARRALEVFARRGWVQVGSVATLHTHALWLRRLKPDLSNIRRAGVQDWPQIVGFLGRQGSGRDLFPVHKAQDLCNGRLLGLRIEDIFVAYQDGAMVGVMALWNQQAYKQTVVLRYEGWLKRLKPLLGRGLQAWGAKPLPEPGQALNAVYASLICIEHNRPAVFRALLQAVYAEAYQRGHDLLLLGLEANHPKAMLRGFPHLSYTSQLYAIGFRPLACAGGIYADIATY